MKAFWLYLFLLYCALSAAGQMNLLHTDSREANRHLYDGKYVKIFYGEKVLLYADTTGGNLHGFRIVQKNVPGKTITINLFRQAIRNEEKTCLQIKNPFPAVLRYKAKIAGKYQDFSMAEVLDIYPGTHSIEYWPATIEVVILYDFSLK